MNAQLRQYMYLYNRFDKLAAGGFVGGLLGRAGKAVGKAGWKAVGKAAKPLLLGGAIAAPLYAGYRAAKAKPKQTAGQKHLAQRQSVLRQGSPGVRSGLTSRPQSPRRPTAVGNAATAFRR